jgi:lysophospholipase L1-like esterase
VPSRLSLASALALGLFLASCNNRTPITPDPTGPTTPQTPVGPTTPTTPVAPPIPKIAVTNFLAFGDSLTEGEWWPGLQYYDPAFTNSYPTFLLAKLQARYTTEQFVMANEGLGGYRAEADDVTGRFVNAVTARKPQVVLLLEGVADLYDNPNSTGIDAVVRALRNDIRNARSRNAWVFISTLTAERDPNPGGINDPGYKERHWLNDALLQQANTAIRNMVAAEAGATLVDGYAITAADPNRLVGADGLHLSIEGYQALAAGFFDAIKVKYELPATASTSIPGSLLAIR